VLGTESGFYPFWSPDGRSVAFFIEEGVRRIDLAGGAAQTLSATRGGAGGTWSPHGVILYAGGTGPLFRISAAGGEPRPATTLDASRQEQQHRWPCFLPDGRHFIFLARSGQAGKTAVFAGSLDSPEVRQLVSIDTPATYAAPGYLLYVREGTLTAQPFDAETQRLTGEAFRVGEQISPGGAIAGPSFSASSSSNRVLAYRAGVNPASGLLVWFDRTGRRLGTLGEPGDYSNPALSPDGKRLAVARRDPKTATRDIWLYSRWIAYVSNESGEREVYVQDFPKPTGKWQISTGGGIEVRWRRDGRELFYVGDRKIMAVDVRMDGTAFHAGGPRPLFEANFDQRILRNHYVVSADGQRFLVIVPTEQGSVTPITVVVNWR
jgi:Tol biopolymer transport system component